MSILKQFKKGQNIFKNILCIENPNINISKIFGYQLLNYNKILKSFHAKLFPSLWVNTKYPIMKKN